MMNSTHENKTEEQEIDLLEIIRKLWNCRSLFYKSLGGAFLISLVIVFSIPKEYTVTVTLAPEAMRRASSSLANMAAMMGLGGMSNSNENDALNVLLYPDIITSNPFILELYNMDVCPMDGEQTMPLNKYMEQVKRPWWSMIVGFPSKVVGGILSIFKEKKVETAQVEVLDPFRLNAEEAGKIGLIKRSIKADVNKKTGVTTITVTMQDPLVAAAVADSVTQKLQDYVTAYRTKKTAVDCAYWEKLYKEKQIEYYNSQQKYATYLDENKNLYTQRSKIEGERLQNEMNLAYQVYNQAATQLEMARGKLQEAKPVFAVVEPATVPLAPSAPRKITIIMGCLFLTLVGTAGWILFGEDLWKNLKMQKTKSITTD